MAEFAKRVNNMEVTADVVKKLFSAMGDPSLISFSGGSPANEALPVDEIREIAYDVLTKDKRGIEALRYGSIQGILDLREIIVNDLLKPKGVYESAENVLITSGGLETMNLVCQLYIDKGDCILVESPTFVHCVEIFDMFEAKCIPCKMDENGLIIEDVEEKINKYNPKMIYVIPTFQNPTGRTLSLDRREALAELGSKYDVIILEDDPYRDIRYSGEDLLPIKAFDRTGNTILASSFSKIFSPGSRLGYTIATHEIIEKLCDIKSATNSHTGTISQVLCAEFFKRGYYPKHHKYICDLYRERRDAMVESIKEFLPEDTKYTYPDGGLFTWIELPEGIDTTEMLKVATDIYKVAYVAGEGFFVERDGKGKNCMRLSFGGVSPNSIREGMENLGNLIKLYKGGIANG
jgi:2-aminoadipate transaminase